MVALEVYIDALHPSDLALCMKGSVTSYSVAVTWSVEVFSGSHLWAAVSEGPLAPLV